MISRKALLISTPMGENDSVSGTNPELDAFQRFLLSPKGGAWKPEEIIFLENPDIKLLVKTVADMVADYTITFFSGTGFPDRSGNHFLMVSGDDFFQDTELLNRSPKQLVLIDTGRKAGPSRKIQVEGPDKDIDQARMMYDKWIEHCEPGQLIMHATEENTFASGKNNGGIFTEKLLQVADRIPPLQDKFNLKSILAAGHETPDLLLEEGFEEGPAITYSNGNIKLPFAMAMPAPQGFLPQVSNNNNYSSGFTLGLLLIGLLLGK
jgi:hypothetical protein